MNTPTNEQVEQALKHADSFAADDHEITLAAEVRSLRAELGKVNDALAYYDLWGGKLLHEAVAILRAKMDAAEALCAEMARLRKENAQLCKELHFETESRDRNAALCEEARQQLAELEGQRENWRMSSVCRELEARNARLVAAGEALKVLAINLTSRLMEFPSPRIAAWDAALAEKAAQEREAAWPANDADEVIHAKAGAQGDELAELRKDKARLDWLENQATPKLGWLARESTTGRGCRLHQDQHSQWPTPRAAIDAAVAGGRAK